MKKHLFLIPVLLFHFAYISQVTAQGSQTVANGGNTNPITFSGCQATWTNDQPGIGLPATGTGDIGSFAAVNTGSTPITATITVKPTAFAFVQSSSYSNPISVINTATGAIVSTIPFDVLAQATTVSPDQQYVYMQSTSGIVQINTRTYATVTFAIPGMPAATEFLLNPSGSLLYLTASTNQILVLNTASMTAYATITLGAPGAGMPESMAISPDGAMLYVTDSYSGTVRVINTATNTVVNTLSLFPPADGACFGVAVSPDGSRLFVTCQVANAVVVVNTATYAVTATIPVAGGPSFCVLSADGSTLYISDEPSRKVSVINTATNTITATISVGTSPFGLSLTPDGSQLYVLNLLGGGGSISVINTATNTVINTIALHYLPYAWGSFIAGPCGSTASTYTITVNPSPSVTASAVSGTISACAGVPSASPDILSFSVSGNYLASDITATAPAGFEISLSPGSGYGNSLTMPANGGMVSGIPIYVRLSASAPQGNPTGNITLSTMGGVTQQVAVGGTVNAVVAATVTVTASANPICAGDAVTFTAKAGNTGPTPSYQWTLNGTDVGGNSPVFISSTLNDKDEVVCLVKDNTTCSAPGTSAAIEIIVNAEPVVRFATDPVFENIGGIELTPEVTGQIEKYEWSPGTGLTATDVANPIAKPADSITYQLLVTSFDGCTATGKITVIPRPPLLMANAFTPNGDGHNDVFRIPAGAIVALDQFSVFNRLGMEVFSTRNGSVGWDGSFNGKPVAAGTYVYVISGKDITGKPFTLKGTVTLIK